MKAGKPPGFPRAACAFFRELEANNEKEWFHEHKALYEASVRQPMLALLEAVNEELAGYAPAYRVSDPRKALSRPNRDTRFGPDKRPYRTEISAVLPRGGGPKDAVAGFYFSVGTDGIGVLGGAYMPGTPQLAALRSFLTLQPDRFRRLVAEIEGTRLVGTLQGERLKRLPSGYSADDPAAYLVRYKQLYFRAPIEPAPATPEALTSELSCRFHVMTPFVEFLDEGLSAVR